jgi:hypothetical protein
VEFKTMPYGIRALYIDLINKHKGGLRTIQSIIYRYAPPSENLTDAYVASVSKQIGIPATAVFEPTLPILKNSPLQLRAMKTATTPIELHQHNGRGWNMALQRPDISSYVKNS